MKKTFFLFAAAVIGAIAPALAQQPPTDSPKANPLYQKIILQKAVGQDFQRHQLFARPERKSDAQRGTYQTLALDMVGHRALFESDPKTWTLEIPKADGGVFEAELVRVEPFAPGARFTVMDESGEYDFAPEKILCYWGIVKGKTTSLAAVTLTKDGVQGLFSDEIGNFNLGPFGGSRMEYAFFNDRELALPIHFKCSTPDGEVRPERNPKTLPPDAPNCVLLHVDCDHQLFVQHGSSVAQTTRYVVALFNEVGAVYNLLNLNLSINGITVWGIEDIFSPVPTGGGDASSGIALSRYGDFIQDGHPGEISCLLAFDDDSLGGVAWRDRLCGTYNSGNSSGPYLYCDVEAEAVGGFPDYSWNTCLWAHELGHSLGSHHTHWCSWPGGPIDNCAPQEGSCAPGPTPPNGGGTIMSYCDLVSVGIRFSNGFGFHPGNVIQLNVADADCLDPCGSECVETMSIATNLGPVGALHLEASESIVGFGEILSGSNVRFDAGEQVLLRPGFRAQNGSTFRAYIDGCSGFASPKPGTSERSPAKEQTTVANPSGIHNLSVSPNPFSTGTTISYSLREGCNASLQIFNAVGVSVASPLLLHWQEAGLYQHRFEAEHLPSGIYWVVLQENGERTVKRIYLLAVDR